MFLALNILGLEFSTGEILTVSVLAGGFIIQSVLTRVQLKDAILKIQELKRTEIRNRDKAEEDRAKFHGRLNRLSTRLARIEGHLGVLRKGHDEANGG